MEDQIHKEEEASENTSGQTDDTVKKNENIPEPIKKERKKRTAKGIAGATMLILGTFSIAAILFLTYFFFTGDIEIIAAFFSITALLILTSVLMFFGNVILTLNEKEGEAKNEKRS